MGDREHSASGARLWMAAALCVALAVAGCGGGLGPTASAGPSDTVTGTIPGAVTADDRPDSEPAPKIENPTLDDIMQPGPIPERIMGRADAPVTLIEYASLTCPYCRAFHEKVLADIKRQYIDKGKVRLIVREFPIGKTAGAATLVNRCVREDKYFALLHRFMVEQGSWVSQEVRRDAIFEVARKEGMTRTDFDACFDNQQMIASLKWVKERGRRLGVVGTPTFFVQDVKLRTAPSADDIKRALDVALNKPVGAAASPVIR